MSRHSEKQKLYLARLKQRLLERHGCACEICGTSQGVLEFAHLAMTPVRGRGRGRSRRYLDVLKRPDSYALLCGGNGAESCHKKLDRGLFEPGVIYRIRTQGTPF